MHALKNLEGWQTRVEIHFLIIILEGILWRATGKAGNGKRDGNGKREREFAQKEKRRPLQDLCSLTAPGMTRRRRSRWSCSRTKEHNNGLRVSSFGSVVKTRGSICGETGTHAHLDYWYSPGSGTFWTMNAMKSSEPLKHTYCARFHIN